MKKEIVVFGGSGFLGSYICEELSKRGYKVTIADINKPKDIKPNQKFVETDILNLNQVKSVVKGAEIIFNFSAVAKLEDALSDPIKTININVLGNLNILESIKDSSSLRRFVYSSSAYALSSKGSFYGISKYSSEKIIQEYSKLHAIPYTIIRYGSIYGERKSRNNYLYNLLSSAMEHGEINYFGSLEDTREYIHAVDASRLSVDIIENETYIGESIILTGVERFSKSQLFQLVEEILEKPLNIKETKSVSSFSHYKFTPYSYQPDTGKKLIGSYFIDFAQGLLDCIKSIESEIEQKK